MVLTRFDTIDSSSHYTVGEDPEAARPCIVIVRTLYYENIWTLLFATLHDPGTVYSPFDCALGTLLYVVL